MRPIRHACMGGWDYVEMYQRLEVSEWTSVHELGSNPAIGRLTTAFFLSLSRSKNTWLFLTVIYCSWFVFSKTLLLKNFLLEFFRVALLFICQGTALIFQPRNSDILSQLPVPVKHFFLFLKIFM